jgi:hypothetical protein
VAVTYPTPAGKIIRKGTKEQSCKLQLVRKPPTTRPTDLFRVKVPYEARHKHLWCQSAHWPMEWSARVIEGTKVAPDRIYVDTNRVPGGDVSGAYIKQMSARIELLRHSDSRTSLHMRYEVRAPPQEPSWAVGAITEYADRLKKIASGGKAPWGRPRIRPAHTRFVRAHTRIMESYNPDSKFGPYPSGEHRGAYVPLADRTKFRAGWEAAIAHKASA